MSSTTSQEKRFLIVLVVLLSVATSAVFALIGHGFNPAPPDVSREAPSAAAPGSENSMTAQDSQKHPTIASLNARIQELEESLTQEQNGRLMLQRTLSKQETQLVELKAKINLLAGNPVAGENTQHNASLIDTNQDADSDAVSDADFDAVPAHRQAGITGGRGFGATPTVSVLVEAGVDETVAAELLAKRDARALAELELRDQAAREGWLDADDFDERMAASLPEPVALRDALDTDQWDRYLFASGRPNRVAITSVLSGSAAQNALLQNGDQLLSYAGQRIFSVRDLQAGTREGNRGELVSIQVLRDGQVLDLNVPRGPLGVNLARDYVDPDESATQP